MAIYFKTIYGYIINSDFIEGIFLETVPNKMGEYEIKAFTAGDDYSAYILYYTKDKKKAENKLNKLISILKKNKNIIIDLTPGEENETR